ncbi:hypothetical protein [Flagellimonas eckloniae]|uniref:hypothetical protein n=1 Tax=Flagellimonas eckloniae TaxID=346185 RepID=UPI0015845CEA|nr:hypothetical protein [Allomuricauda eckloniae]
MEFLNKEIETLVKRKKSKSLVKKQISCGIFQDLGEPELKSLENTEINESSPA